MPTGTYRVALHSNLFGYATVTPSTISITQASQSNSLISVAGVTTTSFVGGKQVVINGGGFVTNNVINN